MKRDHQESTSSSSVGGGNNYRHPPPMPCSSSSAAAAAATGKKLIFDDSSSSTPATDAGVDELLAALGYKVRASEMAEVAQKLEQLEMVMETAQEDGLLSHLSSDTVHYNPSDIATWLESMLSEINPAPPLPTAAPLPPTSLPPPLIDDSIGPAESSTITTVDSIAIANPSLHQIYDSDSELRAMIQNSDMAYGGGGGGGGGGGESDSTIIIDGRESKRMKSVSGTGWSKSAWKPKPKPQPQPQPPSPSCSGGGGGGGESPVRPVVVVDSQENGIRLVHALMACAEAVQQSNMKAGEALVKQISMLAACQAGAMKKVATYFAQALAQRIYRIYPPQDNFASSVSDLLQMHFYESSPYLKFAHFTANQAILEAFSGETRVHVIDFGMKQGMQWPALMQALALRPGGPPSFRLTGVGPPQPDDTDALQQVGWKLAQLAKTIHVEFEYRGFVATSLADLEPHLLDVKPGEAVAVNSVFELHQLLARPGAIDRVLATVKAVRPKIVTVVEQEANHNCPVFLDRFTEALHYYSTMFDSLEGCGPAAPSPAQPESQDQLMSEMYLGRQICNVVACEGVERVERHETLAQWRTRMASAGFAPVHLGSNAFKQASMLLALFAGGDGYRVDENNGCLLLGWHTRPLIATSAWQLLA